MPHRTIHLFRKGLRLHDNPTLLAALASSEALYPVYVLDRRFMASAMAIGALRWHFLLQALENLRANLLQLGSCLLVLQGDYEAVLRDHVKKWRITQVTLDAEVEPFYKEMEARIRRLGQELGFTVLSLVSHSLYDTQRILELNGGAAPLTYKRFLHVLSLLGDPEAPVRSPAAEDFQPVLRGLHWQLPLAVPAAEPSAVFPGGKLRVGALAASGEAGPLGQPRELWPQKRSEGPAPGHSGQSRRPVPGAGGAAPVRKSSGDGGTGGCWRCRPPDLCLAECYGVPLPVDLKIPTESLSPWKGGETEGLQRLEQHLMNQGWVANFTKPRTIPNSLLPSTTGLSPYFSLGCLSVRTFFYRLSNIYAQSKNHSLPPVSLQGQLLWREFFYTVASATPNFTKMVGNPICLQINWYQDAERLHRWKTAQTGFPWIDAIMTQLRQEGWIHHLARHAAACFLTRGDLWISWEEGMKVFEELLLDADYSINAGNWMWLSASAFFHQYTRIFCPVRFGKRTDPQGRYIRKYLPVLKNFPSKYIYEPWTASEEEQKEAGCIIGQDYPFPMVNHKEVSEHNLLLMKQVREEQCRTAQLTRDDADDPMEMKMKRNHSEENVKKGKVARTTEET